MVIEEAPASEPDLRDYARVLWHRKATVAVTVVASLGIALALSYSQDPRYASVAKVLLRTRSTSSLFGSDAPQGNPARAVDTEIEVIRTEPVRELVRQKIGSAPAVRVSPVGQTDLITIRAESRVADRAAAIANAYANSYIEFRRTQNIDDLLASSQELEKKVGDLQKQIDDLSRQVDAIPPCLDAKLQAAACDQRDSIVQRRSSLLSQQASFRQRLDQLQVDKALASGGAQLVTPASASSVPFAPTPRRNAVLGVVLGLLIGAGLAFLLEYLDDSIRGKEDLERAVPRIPVLGIIPAVADWKAKEEPRLVSFTDPNSSAAEAYKILRTSIQFLGLDRPLRTIQVTSPYAQEGKTTTLVNLAVAFARSGMRTVLVCCDLRRPRLHEFFGLSNEIGFTSVLMGSVPLASALQPVKAQQHLRVLASGPLPPNPSELLLSRRTTELFKTLGSLADVVLIDSPPTLPVTDALVLSQQVDATILIGTAGKTTRKAVARAAEMLQQVNAPVIGAIVNGVKSVSGYGNYSYNYYYYRSKNPSTDARAAKNGDLAGNGKSNGRSGTAKPGKGTASKAK